MTVAMRAVLALLPLALYCGIMGRWQIARRPIVVTGPGDFGLLAFGLGGLIAFGPAGQFVVNSVFPRPGLPAWMAVASLVGLIAMALAIPTRSRLVIYQIDSEDLARSLQKALGEVVGPMNRTLQGYEQESTRRGVTVDYGPWFRCAVVQCHGDQPEHLARAIGARLIAEFRNLPVNSRRISQGLLALAGLVLLGLAVVAVGLVLMASRMPF